jgi:predicted DCC family thiol-disulfide oxidoreductase YuxK
MKAQSHQQHIVFFDGVCSLCNRAVDFFVRHDKKNTLLFAPLQGTTAEQLLPAGKTASLNTIVYYSHGQLSHRSNAVLNMLWDMGGWWKLFIVLRLIPTFIRDFVYDWISANRYKWFGKKESCRIPTAAERARFLD